MWSKSRIHNIKSVKTQYSFQTVRFEVLSDLVDESNIITIDNVRSKIVKTISRLGLKKLHVFHKTVKGKVTM